jgi:hypothetical protein
LSPIPAASWINSIPFSLLKKVSKKVPWQRNIHILGPISL